MTFHFFIICKISLFVHLFYGCWAGQPGLDIFCSLFVPRKCFILRVNMVSVFGKLQSVCNVPISIRPVM